MDLDYGRLAQLIRIVSLVSLHVNVATTRAASVTGEVVPAIELCTAVLAEASYLLSNVQLVPHVFSRVEVGPTI